LSVSNDLAKPVTEDEFEAMCHALYRRMWNDPGCARMGGGGQRQFGIDILGNDGTGSVGVQCKHYNKTPFTLATVTADIKKVEEAGLDIRHLLFATTASSKSTTVAEIHKLSAQRREEGRFTVSVDFWGEISGHILLHPEIGRAYIPGFPGSTVLEIKETADAHLSLYQDDRETTSQFQTDSLDLQKKIAEQLGVFLQRGAAPAARGDEADPRVVASLDFIRDRLREGKSRDARGLLEALGDPARFTDQFSRFRWHTNHAAVALIDGRYDEAATEFLEAFPLAPDDEKAHTNRAHALLLKKDPAAALAACDESLDRFPESAVLWALKLNARDLLGEPKPDRDLPDHLCGSPDVLFARAHLHDKGGDYPTALELLRQCMAKDGGSFEAKRAYLADALSWAANDPVLAHHRHFTAEQRAALVEAVEALEPLEQTLPAIQSDYVSLQVTNNVTAALVLLGSIERARTLATLSLVRHPLSDGLLRLRLVELDERHDVSAIHALIDTRLMELPPNALAILAEIAANRGDLAWHSEVMAAAESSGLEPQRLRDLRVLSVHARWMAGNPTEAIQTARVSLQDNPEHVLARVLLGQMLRWHGEKAEAIEQALICVGALKDGVQSFEVIQVAELLFDLQRFHEAATLYARLVKAPGDDEVTRRLLICLVESDQRRRARDTLDQLPPGIQALPPFRRIEANLARRMGDWSRMRDLLAQELEQHPDDSGVALGYAGALYRLNDKTALTAYLATDPLFRNSSPEAEFEFSKYQSGHGLVALALARLYRLYRANSGSARAASFYLGLVLLGGERVPELEPPTEAGPGSVVLVRGATETRAIAIDFEPTRVANGWPELVSPESDPAKKLRGLKPGDKVLMDRYFDDREVEVIELRSLYVFAAQKANDQLASAAVPAGPLYSVRIVKEDGAIDVDVLLNSARQRKEHIRSMFDRYRQHRIPISLLARAVGADPVTLLLEWPYREATLFVGVGAHEERDAAIKVLQDGRHRYVLDLFTIAELVQRKSFDAAVNLLGRPLVPQTVREHLLQLRQLLDALPASAFFGEQDGHLQMTEIPQSYHQDRKEFLCEMLRAVDDRCEVVLTVGPHEITDQHRILAGSLDADSLDALYLCIERDAVLISDDGALRALAPEAGVSLSMGVQPVLMQACDTGILSNDTYVDALVGKLAAGHDFVSVRAADLLTLAKRTPNRISEGVRTALETFRKPTLDIVSGVRLSCEFLGQAIEQLQPTVAAAYGIHLLEVLQDERPQLSETIRRAVAETVLQAVQRVRRERRPKARRTLAPLTEVPVPPALQLSRTPVASAVAQLFDR